MSVPEQKPVSRFSWRSGPLGDIRTVKRDIAFRTNGGGASAGLEMMKVLIAAIALACTGGAATAASITNANPDPVTVVVTEGSERVELSVGPNETVEFCAGGCFVEFAGNNTVLTGAEAVEVSGQELKFK